MSRYLNIIKGGALISALLVTTISVSAYDQNNTHPALTDEIVDFYNLSFTDQKISEQEKQWLIQGSRDEDSNARSVFHFYDPVYNRGIFALATSKDWALKNNVQKDFYNRQLAGLVSLGDQDSKGDFSFGRALKDYAKGDRQRAFTAFGHILHLLEDAGVPDHTRNDAHMDGSPYEKEMSKWNPKNFQIARRLWLTRERPVTYSSVGSYFDNLARFSNGNFFSKDTIFSSNYKNPEVEYWQYQRTDKNSEVLIGYRNDINSKYKLVIRALGKEKLEEFYIEDKSLLDGYWQRLSPEIVRNGAGALRLFIEEAERAKEEYATKKPGNKSLWAQLLSVFGIGETPASSSESTPVDNSDNSGSLVTPTPNIGDTQVNPSLSPTLSPIPTLTPSLSPSPTPQKTPTPIPSPSVSPAPTQKININTANKELLMTLKGIKEAKSEAIIQYRQNYGPFRKIEDIMNVTGIGQATFDDIKDFITVGDVAPVSYGGGSSGSPTAQTPTPTPTPTPSPTPTSTPTPTPEPETGDTASSGDVVINEIAWMGTSVSADDEWIELFNGTGNTINMTGWILSAQDGTPNITLSGSIDPSGFYILERTNDDTLPAVTADKIYTGALGNSGEILTLKDVAGNTIDEINGSGEWNLNGGSVVIGDNGTKETAQKMTGYWVTATATPDAVNQENPAQLLSAVNDLSADYSSPAITVSWTAPEFEGFNLASLSYDLRYSYSGFNGSGSWDSAIRVASSSLPAVAVEGTSQSVSFDLISYGETLYFAIKTKDISDPSNISNISNIATLTTLSAIASSWSMLGANQYHTGYVDISGPPRTATISATFDAIGALSQFVADEEGNVYFGSSDGAISRIYSLDINGSENWNFNSVTRSSAPAVLADGTVYFGRIGGGYLPVTALNPDGSQRWQYTNSGSVSNITIKSDGSAHFSSGLGKLHALEADGEPGNEITSLSVYDFAPVILDNGTAIITGRISGNQFITAYSPEGSQLWQQMWSSSNGYLPSDVSYDNNTGKTYLSVHKWVLEIPSGGESVVSRKIDDLGVASTMVAVTPSTLYVGFDFGYDNPASGSKMFALNKADMSPKWSYGVGSKINEQVAVDGDGNIYFSTEAGVLYSLDEDGNENWRIDSGTASALSPILVDGGVVWGYGNRVVFIR